MRRVPGLFWVFTVLGALVVARMSSVVAASTGRPGVDVVVSRGAMPVGHVVAPDDVRVVRAPRSVVPADAARFARTVAGRTVTVAVPARSMVLTSSVGARGRRGVAALIPPGWRSIGVPIDEATPTLRVGIRVDLLGVFTRGAIRDGPPSEVLAADVGVVEVNEHRVTVAVPGPSVARVAEGLVNGQVIVVLRS